MERGGGRVRKELRVLSRRCAQLDARRGGALSRYDKAAGAVLDLDARIDRCRTQRQSAPALPRESDDLLALDRVRRLPVARHAARGERSTARPAPSFDRGRAFYTQRHGQMNLACTQCHDQNWGKRLLTETISQGHPNAFPAYRLEWQSLGSLQRRIRACLFGVRAQMPPPGAPELTDVELYLAWRAQGLPLEAPGVRR